MHQDIIGRTYALFTTDVDAVPPLTLRAGDAIDSYASPLPCDAMVDQPTGAYLERHAWGIQYLDPVSWQYYLPCLIDYALRYKQEGAFVIDSLLFSLRPPEREPPRFAILTPKVQPQYAAQLHYDNAPCSLSAMSHAQVRCTWERSRFAGIAVGCVCRGPKVAPQSFGNCDKHTKEAQL